MNKVLVAFDSSKNSNNAIQYVIELSKETKSPLTIHVVNVQQEPVLFGEDYLSADMIDELTKTLISKSDDLLKIAGQQLDKAGVTFKLHSVIGNVAEEVKNTAQKFGCDTIVMGTRGLGRLSGLLLGSVATQVIHEATVPVILIK